jgi:hypothetical protein
MNSEEVMPDDSDEPVDVIRLYRKRHLSDGHVVELWSVLP